MKNKYLLIGSLIIILVMSDCASESTNYKLPSADVEAKPEWVGAHRAARDTIFIVIKIPKTNQNDISSYVQNAQSELHNLLSVEIELMLRDYWEQKQIPIDDDGKFLLLSDLPRTLEQVMSYVAVSDGWNNAEEVSILCALDYEEIAEIIMLDMAIEDRGFLAYFKRYMDGLAQQHH